MGKLRSEFFFGFGGEMWVFPEVLGKSVAFEREGVGVSIDLPPFDQKQLESGDFRERKWCSGVVGAPGAWKAVGLSLFRVTLREDVAGLSKEERESGRKSSGDAAQYLGSRLCVAQGVAVEFLDWLRANGLVHLGVIGQAPRQFAANRVFDESAAYEFPASFGGTIKLAVRSSGDLDAKLFNEIAFELHAGRRPAMPESLLADAFFFLAGGLDSDLKRAVLFAAIACETKVAETLRTRAKPECRLLVDELLGNPRDFSVRAAGLFHTFMRAAVGVSLRDDNRDLHDTIELLFKIRNRVAHKGEEVPRSEVRRLLEGARAAMSWLDGVHVADGGQKPSGSEAL